jgi:hypothetical protein
MVEFVTALASSFSREADEPMFLGYELALDDLPIEAIERGVRRALRECKFMPSGAELRELCGDAKANDRAILAFQALGKAVAEHGYYASVTFDDPLINAAVNNLGGWQRICQIETQEEWEKWFRKDFERVYTAFCRTGASPNQCSPLIGHCDQYNRHTGYVESVREPIRIACGLPPHKPGLLHSGHRIEHDGNIDLPRINFKKPDEA